ncbi:response regulator transcription factor [Novosphingobium sp. HII-3]|uniref:response regulator transcription factor n=1 Tax=Novosphingobium sp. HII-3 TaxID=2075565 RepID=UPI000CDAE9F3|nr:helix-turn-helix transcriptional regulator [Novosphingobium sp. HII-3]
MCQKHTSNKDVELTARQIVVLRCIADGLSSKETAIKLNITPKTVERHIENVRLRTRSRNRIHMIAQLYSNGLL